MTAIMEKTNKKEVEPAIQFHPAWYGLITGLNAEDMLRECTPYTYLLREGEAPTDYYVSFVLPDLTIKHQPFKITERLDGWCCRNGSGSGPFVNQTIQDIIHLIMHCNKKDCTPCIEQE